ncbi:MAG: UDP-3-O-acyl-N-acetylglucosamine deacetylase [Candidatus Sumerlaeaceae bacterium]|nr:UDP-3-O-acyl-N-acetylglucosamine deacetylase [Candidatus Sumerlaeaceae bacterium]
MMNISFDQAEALRDCRVCPQRTIARMSELVGRGVHFGETVRMRVLPAPPHTGIVFVRIDLPGAPEIPANFESLAQEDLLRRTTLRWHEAEVHTVEHFLAAAYVLGITNLRIELDGSELPFLDGSAQPFAQFLLDAGVAEQEATIETCAPSRPLAFRFDHAEIVAMPATDFRVTFFFSSENPLLRTQSATFVVTPESFIREIAPARTFAFFHEIESLRRRGLIRGGSLASAVVIGRKAILNNELRYSDEPVRHKILDFIGDLALLGKPVVGHFLAWRSGHRANAAFVRFLRKEFEK